MTRNYGLAGGWLDASKHVERAVLRLLTAEEQVAWRVRQMLEERAARAAERN